MTKTDIVKALRKHAEGGEFITKKQIANTLGAKDSDTAGRYVAGLQAINSRYFIPEVADRMLADLRIEKAAAN